MKNICLLLALTIVSLTSYATTYALYGAVPDGASDLTSKVTAAAQGAATFEDGVFTGAGLPGRICETDNYLKMSFDVAQTLTLTDKYALHIVLSKAEGATGDVQVSFCKNGWNAARTAWTISNANIESGTATDIPLRYADCNTGNWNSYSQETFIGKVEYPANEILRICAANGEQFTISQIYLVSEEEQEEPEPEEPDDNIYRYYLYRGNNNTDPLPNKVTIDDEEKEVISIDVRPTDKATIKAEQGTWMNCFNKYSYFITSSNVDWFSINHQPATSVPNTIKNDTYYLVVRFKSNLGDGAFRNNQMRFNLSNGAKDFYINNTDIDGTYNDGKWHTVTLALKDASGSKLTTYLRADQIAFQIHLNGNGESGKYIAIDYAYFTNDISVLDEGTTTEEPFIIYHNGQTPANESTAVEEYDGCIIDQPIEYRRQFKSNTWYSICFPFEVTAVKVENKDKLYPLTPCYRLDGTLQEGHYVIRTPNQTTDLPINEFEDAWLDPETNIDPKTNNNWLPQANTPYIIMFQDDYYTDKWIIFYGDNGAQLGSFSQGEAPQASNVVNVYYNTTMMPQTLDGDYSYHLNSEEDAWIRYENSNLNLNPFECYILANDATTQRYRILRRGAGDDSGTTTSIDQLSTDMQLSNIRVYSLTGVMLHQYQYCTLEEAIKDMQTQNVQGAYIFVAADKTWKIMLGEQH